MVERNYQFRERMLEVHKPGRRMSYAQLQKGQIEIDDGWTVYIPHLEDRVLYNAAKDLTDYFTVSMELSLRLQVGGTPAENAIIYQIDPTMERNQYRIAVQENRVILSGNSDRAAAQAGYHLEDLMNFAEGPYLDLQDTLKAPLYDTRMAHSGYGLDLYPDQHLSALAHAGFTAILLFVKGYNQTAHCYQDFNDIIYRAAGYGLDVYMYSYLKNDVYPEGEEGKVFYDHLYGDIFRQCPGFKGVILVGESCEFRSRDDRTTQMMRLENILPNGEKKIKDKPNPGWWPCWDYPLLLTMIRDAIHKVKPEAELVLWSYNWGRQPEEPRLELIRNLPENVTLEVTFEMYELLEREGVLDRIADYSLYFEGPGKYFISEAEEAKKLGLRLYSMTNTGGATWDFGVIPYVPAPGQWLRRHQAMRKYHDTCGLVGLMESHHFGVYPSFITDLAKWMYHSPDTPESDILHRLAVRYFSPETADRVLTAWQNFDEGIRHTVTNGNDQYGPYRIGPGYPLLMEKKYVLPSEPWAMFGGNTICRPNYSYLVNTDDAYQRILHEIHYAEIARKHYDQGAQILEDLIPEIPLSKQEDARRLAALGRFMARCVETTLHTKQWRLAREEKDYARLVAIAEAEIRNAEATLPLVAFDSRLGWEPSMEYMCDPAHIKWKIATTQQVLEEEVKPFIK